MGSSVEMFKANAERAVNDGLGVDWFLENTYAPDARLKGTIDDFWSRGHDEIRSYFADRFLPGKSALEIVILEVQRDDPDGSEDGLMAFHFDEDGRRYKQVAAFSFSRDAATGLLRKHHSSKLSEPEEV